MAGEMDIQIDQRVQIPDANKHFRLKAGLDDHNSLFLYTNLQAIYMHANTGFACINWVHEYINQTL